MHIPQMGMTEKQAMPDLCDNLCRFLCLDGSTHMVLYANALVQLSESDCNIIKVSV